MAKRAPGKGTWDQLPSGRWRVRVRDDSGVQVSLGTYATEVEAKAVLNAALAKLAAVEAAPTGPLTLRAWGKTWLAQRDKDGVRGVDKERSVWERHVLAHLGDRALSELARKDLVSWLATLRETRATTSARGGEHVATTRKLSRRTVGHALRLVKSALAAAVEAGRLRENVARDVQLPRDRGRSDEPWTFLTAAEVTAVTGCASIPDPERAIYTVAIYSGLRLGELWGMRWEDVALDVDAPELTVRYSHDRQTKSGKVRRVPLLPPAALALKRVRGRKKTGLVFPGPSGGRRTRDDDARWSPQTRRGRVGEGGVSRDYAVNGYRLRAGITRRVRFHDLRHTCASHLLMGTWGVRLTLEEVSAWLGHSSTAVTQRYAHLTPEHLSRRVATQVRDSKKPAPAESRSESPVSKSPVETAARDTRFELVTFGFGDRGKGESIHELGPSRDSVVTHAAVGLLVAVARQASVPREDLAAFARLAIAADLGGELALAVLDGGADALTRAIDLADRVLSRGLARAVDG